MKSPSEPPQAKNEATSPHLQMRRRVLLGVPASLVSMSPLALAGCGGGDGDTTGPSGPSTPNTPNTPTDGAPRAFNGTRALTPITVSIKLPSRLAYEPDQLAVTSLVYGDAVVRDGRATLGILGSDSQLATLYTYKGYPLLYGFVGPDSPEISPHSTAVVLLSFCAGTQWLQGMIDHALRQSIAEAALTRQLAQDLESILNADDTAIGRHRANVASRVQAAMEQLLPRIPRLAM